MTEEPYRWVDSSGWLEYLADAGLASLSALAWAHGPTHPSPGATPQEFVAGKS